jgi:hypothetical protein
MDARELAELQALFPAVRLFRGVEITAEAAMIS